jgi:regulator of protease activity HflC (stomatin/prohibitin superfamily)
MTNPFIDDNGNPKVGVIVKWAVLGFLGFIVLVNIFISIRAVQAGSIEVVKRWGGVTGQQLEPGLHITIPFAETTEVVLTRKVIYETTTEDKQAGSNADYKDYPVDTNTSDGQAVNIFYTVRFSIDPTKASWIVQNIGSVNSLVEKVVKTESRIWARNIPRNFTAEALYSGKGTQEVQQEIQAKLDPTFKANGLVLDSVGVREIKFTKEYVDAIEAKQIAAVQVETEKNKAEQETFKKQQRITQAEGQAKEQELQRMTISPELLQKMWIEAWEKGGSQVPNVILGTNSPYILNLGDLTK